MHLIFSILIGVLLFMAIFCIYHSSQKQYQETINNPYYWPFAKYPKFSRFIAIILLLIAFILLKSTFNFSVAFVSFFIFISPIIFIMILLKNNLKQVNRKN